MVARFPVSFFSYGIVRFTLALVLAGGWVGTHESAQAQNTGSNGPESLDRPVRVFLDCDGCDESYIRRNLDFVSYVRDRQQADVHLLGTIQPAGGGGRVYRLQFLGRGSFEGTRFELSYSAPETMTDDEVRSELTDRIRLGLAPYVSQSSEADRVDLSYRPASDTTGTREIDDPWNRWVFEVSGSGDVESEQSQSEYGLRGELEAERITRAWKLEFALESDYDRDTFERDSTIVSVQREHDFDGDVVRSVGDHFALGISTSAFSSTFSNVQFGAQLQPAAEYNFYPYRLSDQKELTVTYRVGPEYRDYDEITIFRKRQQLLAEQSLDVSLDLNRPWGRVYTSLEGSHFFHDLTKNRVQLFSWVNVRLVEGLSLRLRFGLERVRDQIALPAGDASLQEILLRRRELQTNYEIDASVGLSYTFGSIYNNVVNTRL